MLKAIGGLVLQYNKLLVVQAHLGPADLEEIKIISPKKLKEAQKGALLAAM